MPHLFTPLSNSPARLPIVGVLGSGTELHTRRTARLGAWLAAQEVHLLSGGGNGVMLSVSRAFARVESRKGMTIGIIPGCIDENNGNYATPEGYPNPWIEVPLLTHLPDSGAMGMQWTSRNHINVLSSDVLVILPGRLGTAAEAALAVRYHKPAIAWLNHRRQITRLPAEIPTTKRFKNVKQFVSSHLCR